jgi:hypothetical protein
METKGLKEAFRMEAGKGEQISELPLQFAKEWKRQSVGLTEGQQKRGFAILRAWVTYAEEHKLEASMDPFDIRFHLEQFSKQEFLEKKEPLRINRVDLRELGKMEVAYREQIAAATNPEISNDPSVAIIGSSARLALKMLTHVDPGSELPLKDIDIVTNAENPNETAKKYGVDLAGIKVVQGNMPERLAAILSYGIDCTMNQVAVYQDQIYYADAAYEDVREGNIRLAGKEDPLFGSEGIALPNGQAYILESGFYRTLSFLIRRKGERIIVSKENIEAEKKNIERYWLVLLSVKLAPMKDRVARDEAINAWFAIAKDMGSTETASPLDFLEELIGKFPHMSTYGTQAAQSPAEQIRWLIGKLTTTAIEKIGNAEPKKLPATYTPQNIEFPRDMQVFDLTKFWDRFNAFRNET